MLKGFLSAVEPDQMETLHRGTLEVLERTGLQIQGEFLLRALADAGCRVDFAARRAWFPPALVERQVTAQPRPIPDGAFVAVVSVLPQPARGRRRAAGGVHRGLESGHTLAHFRQVGWNPRLFDRRYFDHARPAPCGDEKMLQQADQTWRQLVASQPAPTLDSAMRRELDRIVSAAQRELLA